MMRAMNIAYEEIEKRNFFSFYAYAILMTLGSFAHGTMHKVPQFQSGRLLISVNQQSLSALTYRIRNFPRVRR